MLHVLEEELTDNQNQYPCMHVCGLPICTSGVWIKCIYVCMCVSLCKIMYKNGTREKQTVPTRRQAICDISAVSVTERYKVVMG